MVDGLTVHIADNDAAGVVVTPLAPLRVFENQAGPSIRPSDLTTAAAGFRYASYSVVLTRQPTGPVFITASAALGAIAATGLLFYDPSQSAGPVNLSALPQALVLTFTPANWSTPQVVYAVAAPDALAEGQQRQESQSFTYNGAASAAFDLGLAPLAIESVKIGGVKRLSTEYGLAGRIVTVTPMQAVAAGRPVQITYLLPDGATDVLTIRHTIDTTLSAAEYRTVRIRSLDVEVIDAQTGGVVVTPIDPTTGLPTDEAVAFENGAGAAYLVSVSRSPAPGETVTVALAADPRLIYTDELGRTITQVTFTAADFAGGTPASRRVNIAVRDDAVVQGPRFIVIGHAVASNLTADQGSLFAGISAPSLTVRVLDDDAATVFVRQTGGSTDVIEAAAGLPTTAPWVDTYSLVLTKRPTANVVVVIDPSSMNAGGGQVTVGSLNGLGQWVDSATAIRLTFTPANWNVPQVVRVRAVDDNVVDDPNTQVFAPRARTLAGVLGPLRIDGGDDPNAAAQIPPPLLYLNEADPPLFVPDFNPNFLAAEPEQVDILNVANTDSVSDDVGTLTGSRLTGLNLGPDRTIAGRVFAGGITYANLEYLRIDLGRGSDRLVVQGTHGGTTVINAGPGDDQVSIQSAAGPLAVNGQDGDDTINVGTNYNEQPVGPTFDHSGNPARGVLDRINAPLRLDGGPGQDTIDLDDSGDSGNGLVTLTGSTVDGLDLLAARVQTVTRSAAASGSASASPGPRPPPCPTASIPTTSAPPCWP